MNKVGEVVEDMLSPELSNGSPVVCALHEDCLPVDKTSFLAAVQLISSESRSFHAHLEPHYYKHLLFEGQVIAEEVLKVGAWKECDCKYCYI